MKTVTGDENQLIHGTDYLTSLNDFYSEHAVTEIHHIM